MLLGLMSTISVAQETKYKVEMSGVTWTSCKVYVRAALEKAFKATNIEITPGKPRFQSVTFTSADKTITRREVEKAMGDKKERYKTWKIRKEKKEQTLKPDYEDGTWHLLLLKEGHSPFTKAWLN